MRLGRYSRPLLGYGVPVFAAVATTFTWFTPGSYVAAGDVPPYRRDSLAVELPELWNHQITGAGSTSYAISQVLDVGLLMLARALGGSPMAAQHALFALVCGFGAFGAAYLAGAWVRHPLARAAAGLLGAFNVFLLVNYPNVLPTFAVGVAGVLGGLLLRSADGRRVSGILFAACTLPLSYLAQNPPLVAVVGLAIVATVTGVAAVGGAPAFGGAAGLLIRAAPWAVLFNLWWLVPCWLTLFAGAGIEVTAQTDVAAWVWTHARSSVGNVVTLNAHWGWSYREYYPYAQDMDRGIGTVLRWLPPLLALAGVALADRRRRPAALTLAAAIVALVFFSKGVHPPLAAVNLWLFEHLPGMWLFRDPMSKLGVVLVLGYAALAGLALERTIDLAGRLHPGVRRLALVSAFAAILGAIAYPWPLWSGDVTAEERGMLPGTRVEIPVTWQRLADDLNAAGGDGKVLVLPANSYYQVHTTWGYYGVDAIPAQLLRRPVLQLMPGGYMGADPAVRAQIAGVESALLAGDWTSVPARLRALGVSHVILRKDLRSSPMSARSADPGDLEAALTKVRKLRPAGRYPVALVYRLTESPGVVQAYPQLAGVRHSDLADLSSAVGTLGDSYAITTDRKLQVSAFRWRADDTLGQTSFAVDRAGTYRLDRRTVAAVGYHAKPMRSGSRAWVELADRNTVLVDGQPLPPRQSLRVPVTDPAVAGLVVGGAAYPMYREGVRVPLGDRATVKAYAPRRQARDLLGRFGQLGDCNRYDERTPEQAGLKLTRPSRGVIRLAASAHAACVAAPVAHDDARVYRVRFSYRNVSGNPARICLWQERVNQCATLPSLAVGDGWREYVGVTRVARGATGLHLFLYADGGPVATSVEYRSLSVEPLTKVGQATVTPGPAPRVRRWLAAGAHRVAFQQEGTARPSPGLHDCHSTSGRTDGGARAWTQRHADGAVELSARDGAACMWTDAGTRTGDGLYRVSFDYRTVSGRTARVCLWQVGPNRCADMPSLERDKRWRRLATTIRPAAGTTAIRLYLYADGQANPPTMVQYRNVSVAPTSPVTLVVTGSPGRSGSTPAIEAESARPGLHQVRVRGAAGTFALTLAESYAAGWRLKGLPDGWRAVRFTANGYANGWLITGTGAATLTLEYAPGRLASAAVDASIAAGLVAALLAWRELWRRRSRGG